MRFCILFQQTKRREIERNGKKDDENRERQDESHPRSEKVYKLSTDIQAEINFSSTSSSWTQTKEINSLAGTWHAQYV